MPIIGIISNPYFDYDKSEVAQVSANVVNFVNSVGATPISILPTNVDEFHKSDKSNLKKQKHPRCIFASRVFFLFKK